MIVEYAPGRAADLYGSPAPSTVLLWHGTQTDSRAAVRVLAAALAERGLYVIAPDWDSHAADHGRADLLASAEFARDRAAGAPLILVGWSLGGVAAAGLTFRADEFGIPLAHTVCLGGAFGAPDPITGGPVLAALAEDSPPIGFTLITGDADDVIPTAWGSDFAAALRRADRTVHEVAVAADHGSIAGARYDAQADRYEPAEDAATAAVAAVVADRIAAV